MKHKQNGRTLVFNLPMWSCADKAHFQGMMGSDVTHNLLRSRLHERSLV